MFIFIQSGHKNARHENDEPIEPEQDETIRPRYREPGDSSPELPPTEVLLVNGFNFISG